MRSRVTLAVICGLVIGVAAWLGRATSRDAAPAGGWQKVHAAGELTVYRGPGSPASYLLAVGERGLLIDAPTNPAPPVKVEAVLLTHHHRDTCAAVGDWLSAKVPVRAAKASAEWLSRANVAKFWKESIPLRSSRTAYFVHPEGFDGVEYTLADGQTIDFHGYTVRVLATPGHSRDHLVFALSKPGEKSGPLLFCGDAVTGDGKLWTPFCTDWDHWTDAGLKPAAESLRKLAKLQPARLFPARGPIVADKPAALLEQAAANVEEVGFLKSFERFTNRLGNPPGYDFLVSKPQVGSAGNEPWSRVSEHLWITGNTYVLTSKDNVCLVLDPWGQRSVEQVEKLRKAEKLGPIEVVAFSHAHYDHYDGVYTLPGKPGYKIWALDIVAAPLKEPFRFRAPFLDARPITFDKVFRDGETATWREYTLKFHALPGQTAFTSGIEATIDGKRGYFTADNFFHQLQYSGSGGWMGLNRSFPVVYAASAQKVLAAAPDWVLAEHGGPYIFNAEDYRRRVRWGEAAGQAADAVCISGGHRRDWNPHRVSVEPVRVLAKPGAEVAAVLRFENVDPRPATLRVMFQGRGMVPDQTWELRAKAGKTVSQPLRFRLPTNLPPGRQVFTISPMDANGAEVADPYLAVYVEP
jgi:glyoxylase-like metal-dependent hydrolase (beta-lactamase superfamily II)